MSNQELKPSPGDYAAMITTATPIGLVIISYELILDNLNEAIENIEKDSLKSNLSQVRALLSELIISLDKKCGLSLQLIPIYIYVNKLTIDALPKRNPAPLEEAVKIMSHLLEGWRSVKLYEQKQTSNGGSAVFKNAQQIYSGLTYDKNGRLVEFTSESGGLAYDA